jgi:hypothetical protein
MIDIGGSEAPVSYRCQVRPGFFPPMPSIMAMPAIDIFLCCRQRFGVMVFVLIRRYSHIGYIEVNGKHSQIGYIFGKEIEPIWLYGRKHQQ